MDDHNQDQPDNQDQQDHDPMTPPDQGGDDVPPLPEPQEVVTIEFRNARFQVPKYRAEWDMNVQFEFEEGRRMHGCLTLIGGGPEGVDAARAVLYAGGVRTNRDFDEFMVHMNEILAKECKDAPPKKTDDDDGK